MHVPSIDTRVTFAIPVDYKKLTSDKIMTACKTALSALPEYHDMAAQVDKGGKTALAWSREMKLDWVWLDEDVEGRERDWHVLFGLALQVCR